MRIVDGSKGIEIMGEDCRGQARRGLSTVKKVWRRY